MLIADQTIESLSSIVIESRASHRPDEPSYYPTSLQNRLRVQNDHPCNSICLKHYQHLSDDEPDISDIA